MTQTIIKNTTVAKVQGCCPRDWLARIVDMYFYPDSKGAVVYRSGAIGLLSDESDRDDRVVFRKGDRV